MPSQDQREPYLDTSCLLDGLHTGRTGNKRATSSIQLACLLHEQAHMLQTGLVELRLLSNRSSLCYLRTLLVHRLLLE